MDNNNSISKRNAVFQQLTKMLLLFSMVFFPNLTAFSAEQESSRLLNHEDAVNHAKNGHFDLAIRSLKYLYKQDNSNLKVLYDLITVLQWSQNDQEAWALGTSVNPKKVPKYVLIVLGRAARNLHHYDAAENLFHLGKKRFPKQTDFTVALAMTLADAGKYEQGLKAVDKALRRLPGHLELLFARGYILQRQEKWEEAARYYRTVLKHEPEHTDAKRNLVFVVSKSGATGIAYDLAIKSPDIIQSGVGQQALSDRGAQWTRWGKLSSRQKTNRFEDTDKAIKLLEDNIHHSKEDVKKASPPAMQSHYDLMVALRDRYRMQDVLIQYEALKKQGAGIPAYALNAAADAYLYLEQPEQARDIYKQSLAQNPQNFDTNMGLFYAYIDTEQHDLARKVILHLSEMTPRVRSNKLKNIVRGVDEALVVEISLGLADSFANHPELAQQRFEALNREAPLNNEIRQEVANIYLSRGWPRRAMEEARIGLSTEPKHPGLTMALSNSLMRTNQFKAADTELKKLVKMYPEDKQVQRAQGFWSARNKRVFILSATGEKASGGPQGSKNRSVESRLYSQPLNYDFRVFATGRYTKTELDANNTKLKRAGAGVEYRNNDLTLSAGLTHNDYLNTDTALFAEITKWLDDHWTLAASFDQFSTETPAHALDEGISARSLNLSASHRVHESRQFNLKLGAMDFSDDNRRRMAAFGWKEGWISGPRYQLMSFLDLDTNTNSQKNTAYFNPEEDRSFTLTMQNKWLVRRRYDHSFHNILSLSVGDYWQKNFGNDDTWSLSYEHQWSQVGSGLSYGISRVRHPYDGVPEYATNFFINFNISW